MLTLRRLTVYPRLFLALYLVMIVGWIALGSGPVDCNGKPLGTDFLTYYAASRLAVAGEAQAVYSLERLHEEERGVIGRDLKPLAWHYPPTFLFVVYPCSLVPYLAALALWLAVTLWAFVTVVRRVADHHLAVWLVLAFPGTFQNFAQGQNGFLSASLLGAGLLLLEGSPLAGGALLGLVSYKPHLALLVPLALLTGRHWRALVGAILSATAVAVASVAAFGVEPWYAFAGNIDFARQLFEGGSLHWFKMTTAFAGVRLLGFGLGPARAVQALVSVATVGAVAWVWYCRKPLATRASVLCLAVLLATPFAFDYDLALLALPLAFVWRRLKDSQLTLVAVWLLPLVAPLAARLAYVPLAPIVLGVFFVTILRQSRDEVWEA